jgi:lipid-A-disaccharide synthase-like uncharacterized protein
MSLPPIVRPWTLLVLASLLVTSQAVASQAVAPQAVASRVEAAPVDDTGTALVAARSLELRIRPLPPGVRQVTLEADEAGAHWFLVQQDDGTTSRLTPDELASLLEPPPDGRRLLFGLLNITSLAGVLWVAMGLLGQALFSGRMILQWIVSERSRRSVVPVGFWWMSLAGASMLLVYFVWRRDIVGVLGQSTGWIIYTRNLWLIYRERRQSTDAPPA